MGSGFRDRHYLACGAALVLQCALNAKAQPAGAPLETQEQHEPAPRLDTTDAARRSIPAPPSKDAAGAIDVEHAEELDFVQALREGGESLTEQEVVALAVRSSLGVAKAKAIAEEAREAASESVTSLYPRLDLLAQYRRLSTPPLIVYPLPPGLVAGYSAVAFPRPLVDQYLLQARISYPVTDLFLTILPRYRAAEDSLQARELNVRSAAFSVALSARESYYNYARARAVQLVARFGVEEAEAQCKEVALLVSTGTQPQVERMRAESDLAAARVAEARSAGSLAVARSALRSLIHRKGDSEISIDEKLIRLLPPLAEDKESLLQHALKHRSELRALRIIAGAQLRTVRANTAEQLPKLTLTASVEEGNPNPRAAPFRREWTATWEALAMLSWSPTDFATSGARAGRAAARRSQTLADIADLEDALDREVSRAYEDYTSARQAMVAALAGIKAAEESYRVRREQLRAGAVAATEVIIAEGNVMRARLDLINAAIDLRIADARLDRAVERGPSS